MIVVLYHQPKDTAAFETYYFGTHLPLAASVKAEVGFTRAVFVKFTHNLDGSGPAYYRKAELWFDSEAALQKGIATPGFKKIGDDFKNFVTGGLTALVSVESPK
ncbi:MAG: EthD family reductase [Gemmatimonadales bacterium]